MGYIALSGWGSAGIWKEEHVASFRLKLNNYSRRTDGNHEKYVGQPLFKR